MKESSASAVFANTVEKIKDMIDVSTIIGDPVYTESGLTIIPVSKVTYGFAGGADLEGKGKEALGGSSGAGVTIIPVAFLLIQNGQVTLKHISSTDNAVEKMTTLGADVMDKVSGLINKNK